MTVGNKQHGTMLLNEPVTYLQSRRKNTGVAILGKPTDCLVHDPKFQGPLREEQLKAGEHIAAASLASELLILDVGGVPRDIQHHYTGRGQYPSFKSKSLYKNNPESNICPNLLYWGQVKGISTHILNQLKGCKDPDEISARTADLRDATEDADQYLKHLNDDWACEAVILTKLLPCNNVYTLSHIHDSIVHIYNKNLNVVNNLASKDYKSFVKYEMSRGGGKLFKYIAAFDF